MKYSQDLSRNRPCISLRMLLGSIKIMGEELTDSSNSLDGRSPCKEPESLAEVFILPREVRDLLNAERGNPIRVKST